MLFAALENGQEQASTAIQRDCGEGRCHPQAMCTRAARPLQVADL